MLKTKSGLPQHCTWNGDRHGKWRVRFQRRGLTAYIAGTPWSPEFMQQYGTLLDRVEKPGIISAERAKPGTVNALVTAYYRSPGFLSLADSTKNHRRRIIDKFCAKYGDLPLKGLKRAHIAKIMADKAETPEAANNLIKLLRVMLRYGVSLGMIENNPTTGIERYRNRGDGFHQ